MFYYCGIFRMHCILAGQPRQEFLPLKGRAGSSRTLEMNSKPNDFQDSADLVTELLQLYKGYGQRKYQLHLRWWSLCSKRHRKKCHQKLVAVFALDAGAPHSHAESLARITAEKCAEERLFIGMFAALWVDLFLMSALVRDEDIVLLPFRKLVQGSLRALDRGRFAEFRNLEVLKNLQTITVAAIGTARDPQTIAQLKLSKNAIDSEIGKIESSIEAG